MKARCLIALVAVIGCESTGGDGVGSTTGATLAETGTKRGSAGGFSATLAKEMGPPVGSLGAAAPGADVAAMTKTPAGEAGATASAEGGSSTGAAKSTAAAGAGSGAASATGPNAASRSGSAAAATAGTAGSGTSTANAVGTATAKNAVAPVSGAASGANTATGATSGSPGAVVETGAGTLAAATPPPGQRTPVATGVQIGGATAPAANRAPVKPSPELAAIKFDLEPNWERDVGEAGTFSLVVKLPKSGDSRVFSVRYGYDDPAAPFDCDQYRKFLDENKLMTVTLNRQRGAACYIEGTEKNGVAAYRYLVNFGGKRLLCHGSLYKDSASASLGDLRDKVLMQAKKICETLTL